MKTAISAIPYAQTMKVGLEFKRRFWEEDDRIYRRYLNTNDDITQIWYPNFDFFSKHGILTAAYAFDKPAERLVALSPEDRIKAALEQGGKIHKQYPADYANGFSVASAAFRIAKAAGVRTRATCAKPTSQLYAKAKARSISRASTELSPGWQAGALESARAVVTQLHSRVRATA